MFAANYYTYLLDTINFLRHADFIFSADFNEDIRIDNINFTDLCRDTWGERETRHSTLNS